MPKHLITLLSLLCLSWFISSNAKGQVLSPKNNEKLVYAKPNEPIKLKVGDPHPKLDKWYFYTAHEFHDQHNRNGLPLGFLEHNTTFMSRMAKVDNQSCAKVEHGVLHIETHYHPDSIDNGYDKSVVLSTAAFRTPPPNHPEFWCKFTENMRIEVRLKRSDTQGINNALWFMGNNGKPWPENGEIDLLENPKKKINQVAHFTLHSKNHHAGVMGGSGSVTAKVELEDMTQWNIYWIEWYPNRIVGGVNGTAYFQHDKGANNNLDWPWSDPEGFFMLITTGVSTNPKAWPGAVNPKEWEQNIAPSMDVDWIRVYTLSPSDKLNAPKRMYY